jgi:LmbE family N-acetylglucosaminyl deacetylase
MILVVVAHPDDESLWFGGTLWRLAVGGGGPITIVSLTNAGDAVRAREFASACERLGARGEMFDLPDGVDKSLPDYVGRLDAVVERLRPAAGDPACVVTHAPHGNERSHLQHVQCHHRTRAWAKARGVPFGFFSEFDPFGETVPKAQRGGGRVRLFRIGRILASAVGAVTVGGGVAVDIDRAAKRALLDAYPSQLDGLATYAHYRGGREWAFFESMATALWFFERL